ncbi:MAG: pilus assembly protein CpaE [Chloroflexota bacterium]
MIPLPLARELKDAGLIWQTAGHDFFAVPDSGLEDRVFVLTDIMAYTELLHGWPVVAFHGTAEWALDYIYTSEVVWIPTEEQLRDELAARLPEAGRGVMILQLTADGYTCTIGSDGGLLVFAAPSAGEAYAAALLHLLRLQDDVNRV